MCLLTFLIHGIALLTERQPELLFLVTARSADGLPLLLKAFHAVHGVAAVALGEELARAFNKGLLVGGVLRIPGIEPRLEPAKSGIEFFLNGPDRAALHGRVVAPFARRLAQGRGHRTPIRLVAPLSGFERAQSLQYFTAPLDIL